MFLNLIVYEKVPSTFYTLLKVKQINPFIQIADITINLTMTLLYPQSVIYMSKYKILLWGYFDIYLLLIT